MALTKEQWREASDREIVEVAVPEWGGTVRVRSIGLRDRQSYEDSIVQLLPDGKRRVTTQHARARLLILTVVDDNGEPLLDDSDIEWLEEKSAAAIERVFDVALKLSGMGDANVDGMVRDFEQGPNGGSTSDSLSTSG